jgi:hypothetical protein
MLEASDRHGAIRRRAHQDHFSATGHAPHRLPFYQHAHERPFSIASVKIFSQFNGAAITWLFTISQHALSRWVTSLLTIDCWGGASMLTLIAISVVVLVAFAVLILLHEERAAS